jgi:hypothetical protein
MTDSGLLSFAVLGHPNEGKSAVVSTLAEDDTVKVSPTPGETTQCRAFPVTIDDEEILRFVDTPGFQVPKQTLAWFRDYSGDPGRIVREFIQSHQNDPVFSDECELLSPVADGAGIIFVADGARPVRSDDRAEMEILRLTAKPRMAIINAKSDDANYTEDWKAEFRKNFNAVRVFNAHRATYTERIALLESLKAVDQDWEPAIETVIRAFKADWKNRNRRTTDLICALAEACLTHRVIGSLDPDQPETNEKSLLTATYAQEIKELEKKAHTGIRKLYKHNIFNLQLPKQSILTEDLFSKRTWQVLGLKPVQLAMAAGAAGGLIGAKVDIAAAGLGFGIFTAVGSALGAGTALWGGKQMAAAKKNGLKLGGYQLQVGPHTNVQFLYVLLDRALLFYAHVINWAHGRRDYDKSPSPLTDGERGKESCTARFDTQAKRICNRFFKAIASMDDDRKSAARQDFVDLVNATLEQVTSSD